MKRNPPAYVVGFFFLVLLLLYHVQERYSLKKE